MPKQLFIVHSSITWRMTLAVIEHHKWAKKDCLLLLDRGFQVWDENIPTVGISDFKILPFRWKDKKDFWRLFKSNRQHHRALQQLLAEEVGVPFSLHLPHTWSYTYLALVRHPLCRKYALLEEGTLSYREDLAVYQHKVPGVQQWLLQGILNLNLGTGFPAYPQPLMWQHTKYAACYGIGVDSFPTLPGEGKTILPPPFKQMEEYKAIHSILITGPWVELKYCSLSEYKQMKTKVFDFFVKKGIRKLHVKFHPLQFHKEESLPVFWEIADRFSDQIKVVEMPRDSSPEEVAFSSQADFYLAYSSVVIYARQFGCRVFSYAKPMMEQWPAFRKVYSDLPPVIKDNMTLLDL